MQFSKQNKEKNSTQNKQHSFVQVQSVFFYVIEIRTFETGYKNPEGIFVTV